MLKAFTRTSTSTLSLTNIIPRFSTVVSPTRAMASGARSNEDLKLSKLFDVSKFTAVVVGIIDLVFKRTSLSR